MSMSFIFRPLRALRLYHEPLLVLLLTVVACYAYVHISFRLAVNLQWMEPAYYAIVVLTAVASVFVRYPPENKAYRVLCRAVALIMGFYALTLWPAFGVVDQEAWQHSESLLSYGRIIAIISALLAWFRPGFTLIPCLYIIFMKHAVFAITTISIGKTDFIPIAEMGVFLVAGIYALFFHNIAQRWLAGTKGEKAAVSDNKNTLMLLLMCAIAIHFANYFNSGLVKVMLNGGALSWLMENQTQFLVLSGHFLGTLPLGAWPEVTGGMYGLLSAVVLPLNLIVLLSQLLTAVAITRIRWTIAFTLFFDVMHISIFLISGVNFWLWVLLNLSIVSALIQVKQEKLPAALRYVPVLFVVFASSMFYIAWLGWYDSRSVRDAHFVAITDEGERFRVPSSYFFVNSYGLYTSAFGITDSGHFPNGPWGSVWDIEQMRQGNRCELPYGDSETDEVVVEKLGKFIRAHHAFILSQLDDSGRVEYDLYAHHHYTNPYYYKAFNNLDKRRIVAYDYVMESNCLDYKDGHYQKQTMHRTSHAFEVAR